MDYCKTQGLLVIRIKDNQILAKCFDEKHCKAVADRLNTWNKLGWPYEPKGEKE